MQARARRSARLGLTAYRWATRAVGPLVPYLLAQRLKRGKEDEQRLSERQGIAARPRPAGHLIWLHAASVGESLSVLTLINQLLAARSDLHVLVTTGTVTSAHLMAERLPARAFHQYVPLDHPRYCRNFLAHWQPDLGVWVESEFWPNLITTSDARGIPLALINARITQKSFEGWQRFPKTINDLVSRFSAVFAQDQASARRLAALGVTNVTTPGNLKHDAAALTARQGEVEAMRRTIGSRPTWLATNTHEGEETLAADVHEELARLHGGLLTFIVPRHPVRGDAIAKELRARGIIVAQRSKGEQLGSTTQIYLADTLGELGLFYRLTEIVFIGGTMNALGGHNPFEPARLRAALIAGPSDFNFAESFASFAEAKAMSRITSKSELTTTISNLLNDEHERHRRIEAAASVVSSSDNATETICEGLLALMDRHLTREVRHA
ncbi:MAG: 3-deoxy-D-manno-octulosonic acid transferase [Parvibaculaceae bacterium]